MPNNASHWFLFICLISTAYALPTSEKTYYGRVLSEASQAFQGTNLPGLIHKLEAAAKEAWTYGPEVRRLRL